MCKLLTMMQHIFEVVVQNDAFHIDPRSPEDCIAVAALIDAKLVSPGVVRDIIQQSGEYTWIDLEKINSYKAAFLKQVAKQLTLSVWKKGDICQTLSGIKSLQYFPVEFIVSIEQYKEECSRKELIRKRAKALLCKYGGAMSVEELLDVSESENISTISMSNILAALLKNENRMITATTAKKLLLLKDEDLDKLVCQIKPNPNYRSAAPMRLFALADCLTQSCKKYGGNIEGIQEARRLLEDKKEQRKIEQARKRRIREEKEEHTRSIRRKELEDLFAPYGLQVRSDSRLCEAYLAQRKPNMEEAIFVRDQMDQMRFFKQETTYDDEYHSIVQDWLEHKGRFDRDEVSEEAKACALQKWLTEHDPKDCPIFPESLLKRK